MTKSKTVQNFEADYDVGPSKRLKPGSIAADLVAYESLGLGKIPSVMSRALDDYVLGYTEWLPTANARLAHTEAKLRAATKEQRTADAQVVSELLRKGPSAFGDLGTALDSVDLVAQAQEANAYARRFANGVNIATKGQMIYLGQLVGGEYRSAFLFDTLDTAWRTFVIISPTSETTLGELTRLESVSTEAREIIGRLLAWAEGCSGRGFSAEELKLIREAIKDEEWPKVPTLERIEERNALEASNSSEGKAQEEAERAKAVEREETQRYGADAAKARQERWGFVKTNAEAERGINRPENSDEDLVGV